MTVEGNISSGSRNKDSQFISTTTDIEVANKYAHKYNCKINQKSIRSIIKYYG